MEINMKTFLKLGSLFENFADGGKEVIELSLVARE